jgi:hypothetical protein
MNSISSFATLNASCFPSTADHVRLVSRKLDCVVSVELFPNSRRIAVTLCKQILKFIFVKKKKKKKNLYAGISAFCLESGMTVRSSVQQKERTAYERRGRISPQPITLLWIEFAVSVCGVVNMCVCVWVCVCSVQFALGTRTKGMGETKVGILSHFFILYSQLFKDTKLHRIQSLFRYQELLT